MKFHTDARFSLEINTENEFIAIRNTGRMLLVNYLDVNSKAAFALAYTVNNNGKYERNEEQEKAFENLAKKRY